MKTKFYLTTLALFFLTITGLAQDRTTVTAANADISDNLDLRAVASVFGDAENLEDFERRLNDPKLRISNLDLNGDNQVDYLRVVESVEGDAHLILIQAVIGRDLYQDVASIEVERDERNNPRVLVVGDVYMYGQNYIYEPVYYRPPVIFNFFWTAGYRPYYSSWYWGYYPSYWTYWSPYSVYTYVDHIHVHINHHHHYNYVPVRPHGHRAHLITRPVRGNAYATLHPNRSFEVRNAGVRNRHELVTTRQTTGVRSTNGTRTQATVSGNTRSTSVNGTRSSVRTNSNVRSTGNVRNTSVNGTRTAVTPRANMNTTPGSSFTSQAVRGDRTNTATRSVTVQNANTRSENTVRSTGNSRSISTPAPSVRTTPSRQESAPAPTRVQSTPSAPSRSYEAPRSTSQSARISEPRVSQQPARVSQPSQPARSAAPAVRSSEARSARR